ncbi:MAG TPA: helix-turn-helix transcriptional regulator, partial [Rariglobus sp.]
MTKKHDMIVIMVEHSAKEAAGGTGNVAARRRALRLSQAELATRCGVSRQFINLLEAGRTQPNVQLAMMLARVLGGTVEELFAGEPERLELDGGNVLGDVRPVAGTRVVVGRVNGRWVTHVADTLDSLGGGFTPADGVVSVTDGQP